MTPDISGGYFQGSLKEKKKTKTGLHDNTKPSVH